MSVIRLFEERNHVEEYIKYRPVVSENIISTFMHYLWKQIPATNESMTLPLAFDVGCGTGHQTTVPICKYFDKVRGIDISKQQIDTAITSRHPDNITFMVGDSGSLPADDESIYLVQAANCLHWLDTGKFYMECQRVLVPGGVLVAYCYRFNSCRVPDSHPQSDAINEIIEEISTIAASRGYTNERHKLIDDNFTDSSFTMPFPSHCTSSFPNLTMEVPSTLAEFFGFHRSTTPFRAMAKAESEWTCKWYDDVVARLMNACKASTLQDPLTYQMRVRMIIGHKPKPENLIF